MVNLTGWEDTLQGHLQAQVRAQAEAWAGVLEAACESALLTGTMGVLAVEDHRNGVFKAGPDPRVPYGMIYKFTSEAGLDQWDGRLYDDR